MMANNNEKIIWDYLKANIGNEYGVAGLMGNLQAESRLSPINLQDSFNKAWNMTDEQFTQGVDNGQIDFCCDGKGAWGYGLAQWTSRGRRIALYHYKCQKQTSIGNLQMQLEFLIKELKESYKSVYNALVSATSIREASDVVLTRFEIPADQSENVKKYRAGLGEEYYSKYADGKSVIVTPTQELKKHETPKYKVGTYKVSSTKGLNVRTSPTTDSKIKGQMPYGTPFAISKVQDEWGYIPVIDGWCCLDYAEMM